MARIHCTFFFCSVRKEALLPAMHDSASQREVPSSTSKSKNHVLHCMVACIEGFFFKKKKLFWLLDPFNGSPPSLLPSCLLLLYGAPTPDKMGGPPTQQHLDIYFFSLRSKYFDPKDVKRLQKKEGRRDS